MSSLDRFKKSSSLDVFRKQVTPEDVFATPQAPQATQQLTPEQTLAASQQAQAGAVPVERNAVEDYFFAVEDAVKKRGQELAQTERDYQEGNITTPEYIMQTAGKGVFGTAADVAGETFMAGAKMLTPEFLEQRVAELASAAAEGVMTSDQWKWAQNHWNELSPRAKKNLESAFNIGFGAAAIAGKAPLQGTGKKMSVKGMAMKRERLAKQVLPQTVTARKQRNLTGLGNAEDRMLNTLMTVKGVSHTNAPSENFRLVLKELDSIDNTLMKSLSKYKGAPFPRKAIQSKVARDLDILKNKDLARYTDPSLNNLYEKLDRWLFDPKVGYVKPTMTPKELVKARRKFDNIVGEFASKGTDESKVFIEAGAQGDIIRTYRNVLNDIVDAVPTDVDTKALRSRSSDLLLARKNYARLADPEQRAIMDMIERHPITASAVVRGGNSTLAPLLATMGAIKKGYEVLPQTLQSTGNILQSPVGAAPAAGLFYTDKEQQK